MRSVGHKQAHNVACSSLPFYEQALLRAVRSTIGCSRCLSISVHTAYARILRGPVTLLCVCVCVYVRVCVCVCTQFGQLGLGDIEDRNVPTPIPELSGVRTRLLACGWRHTLAVTQTGQVYVWGRGTNGQLGHGVEEDR